MLLRKSRRKRVERREAPNRQHAVDHCWENETTFENFPWHGSGSGGQHFPWPQSLLRKQLDGCTEWRTAKMFITVLFIIVKNQNGSVK